MCFSTVTSSHRLVISLRSAGDSRTGGPRIGSGILGIFPAEPPCPKERCEQERLPQGDPSFRVTLSRALCWGPRLALKEKPTEPVTPPLALGPQ
jgi:hypothetical protein